MTSDPKLAPLFQIIRRRTGQNNATIFIVMEISAAKADGGNREQVITFRAFA